MQFTFLDMAGNTLFIRDDADRAQWTQEEMTLDLEFPRLEDKVITIGQRVYFVDPSTGSQQVYEVRQAQTIEPDNYQIVTAENICISELSDEHRDKSQIINKTASAALQEMLEGTLWNVGTVSVNPTSSVDVSRGSVWQTILQIKDNYNVYIEPRVTLSSSGAILRYLDILPSEGVWNGVRLSVDKNMLDPSVTFDDSEVVTALFGYGGTITTAKATEKNKECTFKDVVWTKTSEHPAKPAGQMWIEYPAATAEYGRNGRARFGFYQNTDIKDANLLLEKTWESLKANSKPKISVDGTVADLYRLGYADEPIRLHDIAQVEVLPAGYVDRIQIIRMTTDLLDGSATTLTIGAYIPNIVYIERDTNKNATGKRGGGGKNTSNETTWREYRTTIDAYENGTGMKILAVHNDLENTKKEVADMSGTLEVLYNKITLEVEDRRNADNVLNGKITVEANRITQEVSQRQRDVTTLSGRIDVEAGKITQIVSAVGEDGKVTAASICLAINNGGSTATINASKIYLLGQTIANTITADYVAGKIATISLLKVNNLQANGTIYSSGNITTGGDVLVPSGVGSIGLKNAVYGLQIVQNGNTYTLQKNTFTNSTWQDVGSFSRAVTSFGFAWGSGYTGQLIITANPQGQTAWVSIYQGTSTWNGRTVTIPIKSVNSESQSTEPTVYEATATYTLPKSDISAARGNPSSTQISSDDSITGITQNGYYQITVTAAGTSKTYSMQVNVPSVVNKSDISAARGNRSATQITSDDSITAVTQNGYYQITVTVLGTTKTYSMQVNVPSTVSKSDISAARGNASSTQIASDDTITTITDNGYYQITVTVLGTTKTYSMRVNHNPYPSSMTLSQKTNASGSRQFTAYYLNGSTYVSMGLAYWYSSSTNLNTSSKTVHY